MPTFHPPNLHAMNLQLQSIVKLCVTGKDQPAFQPHTYLRSTLILLL